MSDIIKQKLDIAKRAGELHGEISSLHHMKEWIEKKKTEIARDGKRIPERIFVTIQKSGNEHWNLDTYKWDKDGSLLHDALIHFLDVKIEDRMTELNELIKVLQ